MFFTNISPLCILNWFCVEAQKVHAVSSFRLCAIIFEKGVSNANIPPIESTSCLGFKKIILALVNNIC